MDISFWIPMASYFDSCCSTAVAMHVLALFDNFVNMTSSTSIVKISLTPQQIVKKRQSSSEKKPRILQHVYSWFLIWWQIDFFPKPVCHPLFLSHANWLCTWATSLQMESVLLSSSVSNNSGLCETQGSFPKGGVSRGKFGVQTMEITGLPLWLFSLYHFPPTLAT